MKNRCPKCKYLNTDKKHNAVKQADGSSVNMTELSIRCYRVDKPDVELCPECKAVL